MKSERILRAASWDHLRPRASIHYREGVKCPSHAFREATFTLAIAMGLTSGAFAEGAPDCASLKSLINSSTHGFSNMRGSIVHSDLPEKVYESKIALKTLPQCYVYGSPSDRESAVKCSTLNPDGMGVPDPLANFVESCGLDIAAHRHSKWMRSEVSHFYKVRQAWNTYVFISAVERWGIDGRIWASILVQLTTKPDADDEDDDSDE